MAEMNISKNGGSNGSSLLMNFIERCSQLRMVTKIESHIGSLRIMERQFGYK